MCQKCADGLKILEDEFGRDDAQDLLWNATCYPLSPDKMLEQVVDIIGKHKSGMTAGQILCQIEAEMDAQMEAFARTREAGDKAQEER